MSAEPEPTGPDRPDNPGLPVPPPVLLLCALVLAGAGEWLLPLRFLQDRGTFGWQFWLGVLAFVAGAAVAVSGVATFRGAGTHVEPHKPALMLVTSGPYRFTRNPIYWGFLLTLAGIGLIASLDWGLILLPVLWLALDRMIVVREERYLAAKFGDAYAAFKRHTRRWL